MILVTQRESSERASEQPGETDPLRSESIASAVLLQFL